MTSVLLTPKQIYRKEYYEKNKEKAKTQIKARYLAKKEELLEYQRQYRIKNKSLIVEKRRLDRHKRQQEAVDYLGGKCSRCRGNFPLCVYDFHHTNPETKLFTIGENWGISKQRLFDELDKCILLCANCHRIHHMEEK